jgi:predicted DNA-binding mobile mystery protein A
MKTQQLRIKQLDQQFASWQKAKKFFQPKDGWIRTIRSSLGMTAKQFAERLRVSRSRVVAIESHEKKYTLTMKTLSMTADALGCDLIYAFIPRKSLQKMIDEQAERIAVLQIKNIAHNMLLENQSLSKKQNLEQIEEQKRMLLSRSFKKLWGK